MSARSQQRGGPGVGQPTLRFQVLFYLIIGLATVVLAGVLWLGSLAG